MFRSAASATASAAATPMGATAALMAISTSPRKVVPLAAGDDGSSRRNARAPPAITKRAFFCGVVVEGPGDGMDLSEDVQDLVASLGDQVSSERPSAESSMRSSSSLDLKPHTRPRADTNTSALANFTNELLTTERNYVQRLRILKESYADPLRMYSRNKETMIIDQYTAKQIFGNVDQLLPVNEAFLHDLEIAIAEGSDSSVGGVGDVALYHFKELRAFECYKTYYANTEEAQKTFKRETAKKSSTGFAGFIERIMYSTNDPKNRVGLRELLIEPVQRIPRYKLFFEKMIKCMPPSDPQRAKLIEAVEIASRVALAETDDHTRLAATLNCLSTSIDGFPPALISSGRRFIDCIDVEDNVADAAGMNMYGSISSAGTGSSSASGASGSNATLHCTLFLFDDKLMIVKRPNNDKPGRVLAGLDDVERLASGALTSSRGRGLASMKRGGMSCKGVLDITDVNATDLSGVDMHLYLEDPPQDQTERWSGRPFRVLSAVIPGSGNLDLARTESEKRRFLENLWRVQARYRTRAGQSVALCADEQEVESRGGRVTMARTYFNVYQRTMFLKEMKKTKVVLHIDSLGDADPLPISMHVPPYVVIRVQPLPGELCRYSVQSSDPEDEPEEDVVQTERVPSRVVNTIHQYGLFKFRTNNPSRPATPSGGNRSRAHIFGLDVLSRNLFGSSKSRDPFSNGSIGNHRRSKSAISHSSTVLTNTTGTSTTTDSVAKFTSRSNSTAATSVSSFAADGSLGKRSARSRKLVKRNSSSRSPGTSLYDGSDYEMGGEDTPGSMSRRRARSVSLTRREDSIEYSDPEDDAPFTMELENGHRVSQSEMELTMRLELARRNSKNQQEKTAILTMDGRVEETIYEEEPPVATRPSSRASRSAHSTRETARDTLSVRSTTPTPASRNRGGGRSPSCDRRPLGPRAPSPLPATSPTLSSMHLDIESALERMSPERPAPPELHPHGHGIMSDGVSDREGEPASSSTALGTPTQLPRLSRMPLLGLESTPKAALKAHATAPATLESDTPAAAAIVPLSIKKKAVPSGAGGTPVASSALRRSYAPDSPLAKAKRSLPAEDRRVSPPTQAALGSRLQRADSVSTGAAPVFPDEEKGKNLVRLAETTREDIESSRRALKRIKLEVNAVPTRAAEAYRQTTPTRGTRRTPTRSATTENAAKREKQARMEEMHALIGQRRAVAPSGIPRAAAVRTRSLVEGTLSESHSSGSEDSGGRAPTPEQGNAAELQTWARGADEIVNGAERDLAQATSNVEQLLSEIGTHVASAKERWLELERARAKLRSAERQCELVKRLLQDATEENEIMYEAYNEELDGMFRDVTLPREEAWTAMTADLRGTKEERNRLRSENAALKRSLEEAEMQRDEWASLLRRHGLIE